MRRFFKLSTPVLSILIIGLLGIQFMQSCRRHIDYIDGQIIPFNNTAMVQATIAGKVVDESGTPIKDAWVSSGNYTTTTDSLGIFFLKNMNTPKHATTVVVKKTDYFNGSRTIMVKAGDVHQVKITLLARGIPKTFVASNGGNVDFGNGFNISFDQNIIYNPTTGNDYNGQVYVYANHISADDKDLLTKMPGDLRGITENTEEERLLQTFGMMAAELTDINGNMLQIRKGGAAHITMNVPASLAGSAPTNIPLWYFDEQLGLWKEEGTAFLKASQYHCSVQHFSFWNCDQPAASVNIEMTLVDQNNNPLQGYSVKLTNQANNDSRTGNTNNSGWVGGLAYANATLTMQVFSGTSVCSPTSPLLTQSVVTSSVNLNLGIIMVNLPVLANCTYEGDIIDCSNLPNGNTVVYISPLNIMVTPNSSGYFLYTLPCVPTTPVTFTAYDLGNSVYGSTTLATSAADTNVVGNIYACGNVTPFLNLTLTNTATSVSQNIYFSEPLDTIFAAIDTSTVVSAIRSANNLYFGWSTLEAVVGTFTPNALNTFVGTTIFTDTQYSLQPGSTVTYTSFPWFPGHILGTFNFNLLGVPSNQPYTAVGSFRAPRTP